MHPTKLRQYARYRKTATDLHSKILAKYITDDIILQTITDFDLGKDFVFTLDTDQISSSMMEYMLYELDMDGQNMIAKYQAEVGGRNRAERDVLAAQLNAKSGLFVVEDVYPTRSTVYLRSLSDGDWEFELTDLHFSQTQLSGFPIVFRPLEFPDVIATSGVTFMFFPQKEAELLAHWRQWETLSTAQRFANIFQLHQQIGVPTAYA